MSDISQANQLLTTLTKSKGVRIGPEAMADAEQLVSEGLASWKASRNGNQLFITDVGNEEKAKLKKQAR